MQDDALRILLVEPWRTGMSPTFAQLAQAPGKRLYINFTTTCKDALRRVGLSDPYDLILVSIHLPDAEGTEALTRIIEAARPTPVAALLGGDDGGVRETVEELGAAGVFWQGGIPVDTIVADFETILQAHPEAARRASTASRKQPPAKDTPPEPIAQPDGGLAESSPPAEAFPAADGQPTPDVEVDAGAGADSADTSAALDIHPDMSPDVEASPDVEEITDAPEALDAGDRLDPEEAISLTQGEMEPESFGEAVPEADAVLLEDAGAVSAEGDGETVASLRLLLEHETHRCALAEESIRALETRCQELEDGQTALIEAEHVAIDRERAAREEAEAECARLRAEVASLRGGGAVVSEVRYAEEVRLRGAAEAALRELQAEMETLRQSHEAARVDYEERLAAERHATEVLHNRLTDAQVRVSELEDEHMKLRNEHRHARQVEKHVTQLERRCAELEPLAEENKRCEHMLGQTQDALQAAEARISELEAAEGDHLAVREERDALLQELGALKDRMEQAKAHHAEDRAGLERELAEVQEERNRLDASIQEELERAKSECGAREAECRELEKKLAKAMKQAQTLQGADATLKEREWSLQEAEEALRSAEARVEELVEECNTLTARHAELEAVQTQCNARGDEIKQLRTALQEAQVQVMVLNGELTQLRTVAGEVAKRDRTIADAELRLRAETERREALEVSLTELRATLQDRENSLSLLQSQLQTDETKALPPVGDGTTEGMQGTSPTSGGADPMVLQARLEEAEVAIQALRLKGEDADHLAREVADLQTRLAQTEATLQAERHTRRALESTLAGLRAAQGIGTGTSSGSTASASEKERGMARQDVAAQVGTLAASLKADDAWQAAFSALLGSAAGSPSLWEAAKKAGAYMNTPSVTPEEVELCKSIIATIRDHQGEKARTSDAPTTVVFGTSGWRGVIGEDFTVLNVHKVVRGIVEMMRSEPFLQANGYEFFEDVQVNGIVVFRDNRYMGDTFMDAAMRELAAAGIRIHAAGECPTGVGSALVTELSAAGSINFTPSHNPMDYAGIKFNPADGGPAGPELTTLIEEAANAYMVEGAAFTPADTDPAPLRTPVDAPAVFTEFVLKKSKVFDLAGIRQWMLKRKEELALVVDFMHGSSRGYVEAILGDEVLDALRDAGSVVLLNENEDYSFHGVKPEPSAENQAPLLARLQEMNRPLSLAVALDPDADRIRFADAHLDIDMNRFGAIAYANLLHAGCKGGIASTAPSSDFALEIARREGMEVFETEVGFKNFREPLGSGAAILAFEESDGISCTGHTLEKCALAGFLLALKAMADQGTNLSTQYAALREKYGYFYPSKAGADVTGVSVEAWQAYKKAVVETLQTKLYKVGDTVEVGGETKTIASINTIDGLKVIFEDKSWILLRPSGTEPKFRYYFELASKTPLADEAALLKAYEEAGGAILQKARDLVDASS